MRHTECMRHTQSRTVRVPFKVCVRAREPGMEPGTLRPCHGAGSSCSLILWLRMYVQLFTEHIWRKKCFPCTVVRAPRLLPPRGLAALVRCMHLGRREMR